MVQISSESVKFPGFFQPYQFTKISMEAFVRSIRPELVLKGIRLIIIRPGAIRTSLSGELEKHVNPVDQSVFQHEFDSFVKTSTRFVGRILSAEETAEKIFRAVTARRPKYIYHINNNPLLSLMALLPQRLADRLAISMVRKKKNGQ